MLKRAIVPVAESTHVPPPWQGFDAHSSISISHASPSKPGKQSHLRWISSDGLAQMQRTKLGVETVREFIRYTIRYSIKGENSIISPDCNLKLKNPIAQSPL